MEGHHCLQAMKIVHRHANGRFGWLISEHQGVNPSREAISILSGKYKKFTFVHLVLEHMVSYEGMQKGLSMFIVVEFIIFEIFSQK